MELDEVLAKGNLKKEAADIRKPQTRASSSPATCARWRRLMLPRQGDVPVDAHAAATLGSWCLACTDVTGLD